MNLQGSLRGPLVPGLQAQREEIKNNNKHALFPPEGDANANEIRLEDGGLTGDAGALPPLVSQSEEQDKVIIWGTDSPCEDLDLEEFELLECQELEAYLAEEQQAYKQGREGGMVMRKGLPPLPFDQTRPASCMSTLSKMTEDKDNGQSTGDERTTRREGRGPEDTVSYSLGGHERARAQFRSENNIFVSCLSTVSSLRGSLGNALDNAGQADYWQISSDPHGNIPEDLTSATSAKSGRGVDLNQNSTALPQELHPQAQPEQGASHKGLPQGGIRILTNGSGRDQGKSVDPRGEGHGCQQAVALRREREQNGSKEAKEHGNGVHTEPLMDFGARACPHDQQAESSQGQPTAHRAAEVQSQRWTCPSLEAAYKASQKMYGRPSQNVLASELLPPSAGPGATPFPAVVTESKGLLKQGSVERNRDRSASPSSLERKAQLTRKPWGSPTRPSTPVSPKRTGSPQKRPPTAMAKAAGARTPQKENGGDPRAPGQTYISSGIPKPLLQHLSRAAERAEQEGKSEKSSPPKCPPKPKNVRPKIITYIRKSPQVKPQAAGSPYEASTLPPRLSYSSPPTAKDPKAGGDPKALPVLSASNLLYDKYRQEMQRARLLSSGLAASGIKPPSHTVPHKMTGKSDGTCGGLAEKYQMPRGGTSLGGPGRGDPLASQLGPDAATSLFQAPRVLRPQLGVGAVSRQPFNKNRMFLASQRPALAPSQPVQAVSPSAHYYQEPSGDQRKPAPALAPKSFLPKPGQSGLRPPGYSRLPAARLAAFGFVRSGSVSSVSSNQSSDSTRSDPCRPMYRPSSVSDDPPLHRVTTLSGGEAPRAPSRSSPLPPNAPAPTRRSLMLPARGSPVASRKEIQKDVEVVRPVVSSPKKCAVVSPKPQSPVHARQKPAAGRGAGVAGGPQGAGGAERLAVQCLQDRCEQQAKQLLRLQAELRRAALGLEVFAVSTQHFSRKTEGSAMKERELSLELSKIRDEVAFSAARWERLQREKEELERSFERELQELQVQQEAELGALEEGLRARHRAESDRLQAEHQAEMDQLRSQQQEQIEEMTIGHEAAVEEMQNTHSVTMATLQEDHATTVQELRQAHKDQRKALEEDFEKLRLSLQDQVDTLTIQNRGLRDRADRFEEALRKSADEQIGDALAPYQHIQEDLKSLKEVLEMKNQQIHEQEKTISQLQKMQAQKNVFLEERVQVLQQQNEDLRARIDKNLTLTRQLSEENANLQEHVEKESSEKKRLSRNNEELLWRLQTGELSPRMSPCSSPLHRASPGPASPSRVQPFPQ
ncbi:microtubule-associated tumor suppressor candidate 2 homolog isoform X1 [Anguilla rostrata]|uniref:microtubule-associated tumor suppressor candidate 2 homolog isoform X1 n=1 Tax=Anguilla rostrata TaxID=7938 RepID=UPI0030CF0C57